MPNSKTNLSPDITVHPKALTRPSAPPHDLDIPSVSYLNATGKIRYTITNDYMFNVIFRNYDILAELLCSLLALKPEQIHHSLINIEMQVNNLGDWFDRSLSYLCRSFDQLYHGEQYASTRSVLHIGILDFNIFPEQPEFYAAYKLMNIKNHQIYNDKLELRVLQLDRINLATKEDRENGLARWASIFKATTWEEIKMLAHENPVFDKVAQTLYKSNADEQIRYACQAREEYELHMRRYEQQIEQQQAEYDLHLRRYERHQEELENENTHLKNELNTLRLEVERLKETQKLKNN